MSRMWRVRAYCTVCVKTLKRSKVPKTIQKIPKKLQKFQIILLDTQPNNPGRTARSRRRTEENARFACGYGFES